MGVLLVPMLTSPASGGRTTCFGQEATITDGNQGHTIHGTPGDDVIVARRGKDRVFAGRGDDLVCGGGNNDRIQGGRGADMISGGPGNDVPFRSNRRPDFRGGLFGKRGDDVILGRDGIDRLEGGRGDDELGGGREGDNDVAVTSIAGTDGGPAPRRSPRGGGGFHASWGGKLIGGGGDDRLRGGGDVDLLDSRDDVVNNDRLNGGDSNDDCHSDPDPERRC
jgi:Ca2+-binding RTX toxin-like protein